MYRSCVAHHWRTMFDEVSDGPILRQGASLATNNLFSGDTLRTSPQPPLSRSDLVLWHEAAEGRRAENVRSARAFQTSICSAIAIDFAAPLLPWRLSVS